MNLLLRPSELITIGARAGHGKTTLATTLLSTFAEEGYECLLFSLEMPKDQLNVSKKVVVIDHNDFDDLQGKNLIDKIEWSLDYIAPIPPKTIVAIDYIQLMGGKIDDNVWRLKKLALKYNIPVIILSQLNRKALTDKVITEANISRSDFISHTSDQIWLIEPMCISVVKNRRGKTGRYPITFDKENRVFYFGTNTQLDFNCEVIHEFFTKLGKTRRLNKTWDNVVETRLNILSNGTTKFLRSWYIKFKDNYLYNSRGAFDWFRLFTGKISKYQANMCKEMAEIFDPDKINDIINEMLSIMSIGEIL